MCLSANTIILFNKKIVRESGEDFCIRDQEQIENLRNYVNSVCYYYDFDIIETYCLAAYQIIKGHYFLEGNKRTAYYVLINCLKKENRHYNGRPIDLARKIEEIAKSNSADKKNVILDLAYFIKSRL